MSPTKNVNLRKLFLLPLFSFAIIFNLAGQELSDNLVGYWSFDNNLLDATGVNNGIIVGNESYTSGQFGQAIDLDGSSYVNAGNDVSLFMNGKSFSISLWFTVDGGWDKAWETLIAKGENLNFRLSRFSSNPTNMNWRAGNVNLGINGTTVADGNIHHIVVTKIAGGAKTVYLDGTLLISDADATSVDANNTTDLWIGNNPESALRQWDGIVDDLGIWDRVLTEEEITEIYSSGLSLDELLNPAPIPTLGQWGLIILGFCFFTIGLVTIRQRNIAYS